MEKLFLHMSYSISVNSIKYKDGLRKPLCHDFLYSFKLSSGKTPAQHR